MNVGLLGPLGVRGPGAVADFALLVISVFSFFRMSDRNIYP